MLSKNRLRREIRATIAVARTVWKMDLSYPLSALYFIAAPFIWYAPFILYSYFMAGGRSSVAFGELANVTDIITYITLGSAFSLLTLVSMWSTAYGLRREQWIGTFESVYVAPVSRFSIVFGHSLHSISHIGIGVLLQVLFIHLIIGIQINLWGIFPSLVVIGLSIIALQAIGLVLATIVLTAKQGWMASEIIGDVMYIFTPAVYPISVIPEYIRILAYINPLYYGTEAFRGYLIYGPSYTFGPPYLINLLIIDVIALAIGITIFNITERKIRSKGELGKY